MSFHQITGKHTASVTGLGNLSIANGAVGSTYTMPWTGAGAGQFWHNGPTVTVGTTSSSALKVSGDADITGNLMVQGTNVTEVLAKIQDRLAILVPDPKLLTKYEALREAYEHYRTLEALCVDSDSKER
jgi:hypothetical protein